MEKNPFLRVGQSFLNRVKYRNAKLSNKVRKTIVLVVQNPTENSMNDDCKKEYVQNKSEQTTDR